MGNKLTRRTSSLQIEVRGTRRPKCHLARRQLRGTDRGERRSRRSSPTKHPSRGMQTQEPQEKRLMGKRARGWGREERGREKGEVRNPEVHKVTERPTRGSGEVFSPYSGSGPSHDPRFPIDLEFRIILSMISMVTRISLYAVPSNWVRSQIPNGHSPSLRALSSIYGEIDTCWTWPMIPSG